MDRGPVSAFLAVQLAVTPVADVFKLFSRQLIELSAAGTFCPKNLSMAKHIRAIFPVEWDKIAPRRIVGQPSYVHAQHIQLKPQFSPFPMTVVFFPCEKLLIQFLLTAALDQLFCQPSPLVFRQISDIRHHTVPVAEHFVPAFTGDEVALTGIIVNAEIRKGQFTMDISDVFHLRRLTI